MIDPSQPSMLHQYMICQAQPRHYENIARLAGQLGYESTVEQIRLRLESMKDAQQHAIYVAENQSGSAVGWIGVCLFRAVEMDCCANISGLVVDYNLRSQGIGEMLLDAAERWARSLGCEVIIVASNVKRERAHSFYRRKGYAEAKTQYAFFKNLGTISDGRGEATNRSGLMTSGIVTACATTQVSRR
jgi:GNAT superfamily N-acetyltransferase